MNVLFVAAEAHPFIKTGGLGDVAYALPKALRTLGIDARVILPKYSGIKPEFKNKMKPVNTFTVPVGWRNQYCGLEYLEYDGIPFYFLDNEYYFKRESSYGVYGHYDDGERYAYFCRAILEAINHMGDFKPEIIHCNDWHSGMVTPLLKEHYKNSPLHSSIKTIFTIHNLQYQGVFPESILHDLLGLGREYFAEDKLKYYDGVSFMKGGLNFADVITTVSHTYAEEIKTSFYGEGLDGLMRYRSSDLHGIVNGVDFDIFNPETDDSIYFKYNSENSAEGKARNKAEFQRSLNLPVNTDIPMIGMVTRLASQKGIDLINTVMEDILKLDLQFVVLGTGEAQYEDMFKYYEEKYPDKLSANILFDNSLAKRIYASSDMFLMPSLFEPCGIGQLIALRYGTIPIARETGGLNDTVKSYNEYTGEGNGFTFTNYNAHDMLFTIQRSLEFFKDKNIWNKLVKSAMLEDNSWSKSAGEYKALYESI